MLDVIAAFGFGETFEELPARLPQGFYGWFGGALQEPLELGRRPVRWDSDRGLYGGKYISVAPASIASRTPARL
jgi:hypothetical protein